MVCPDPNEDNSALARPIEDDSSHGICQKCKAAPAEVLARHTERLCFECLNTQILSKIRSKLRTQSVLTTSDSVAVAFSGGTASTALVHFLTAMQATRTDRPERQKIAFGMHIIHIDESSLQEGGAPPVEHQHDTIAAALASIPSLQGKEEEKARPLPSIHYAFIEDVFAQEEPDDRKSRIQRLKDLLAAIPDVTGRQDMLQHLKRQVLLFKAAELGCNKLALGHSATSLAAHVISQMAKGSGYSVTGDVQRMDARLHSQESNSDSPQLPVVIQPLCDIGKAELAIIARCLKLQTVDASTPTANGGNESDQHDGQTNTDKGNINSLAHVFVQTLQQFNPGAVSNIMSTMSRLQAFDWNTTTAQKQQQEKTSSRDVFCPVCESPFADEELVQCALVCHSCAQQVAENNDDVVVSKLPRYMQEKLEKMKQATATLSYSSNGAADVEGLRSQIAEFLLH